MTWLACSGTQASREDTHKPLMATDTDDVKGPHPPPEMLS
jgi:hypothetical protein